MRLFWVTVRVWREETRVKDDYTLDNQDLQAAVHGFWPNPHLGELALLLLRLERVNAVEVKDESGNGVVLYREWP